MVSSTTPCLKLAEKLASEGRTPEFIFNLQPSSPLRNAQDIVASWETLQAQKADFLVSATPIDPHYFHWALIEKNQSYAMYFGKEYLKERPLLPEVLRPNGAIKLARLDSVKETGNFFGPNLAVHIMPEERGIHVATAFDFLCAEAVFKSN